MEWQLMIKLYLHFVQCFSSLGEITNIVIRRIAAITLKTESVRKPFCCNSIKKCKGKLHMKLRF